MQTKRDQVQSHLCVVGRLNAAIVSGEPDAPDPPMRRVVTGGVAGLVVGALVVAGFGVYGLIRPGGSTDWRTEGALVQVKESAARFVYLGGELHPVVNFASAKLIGGRNSHLVSVHENTIKDAPHGLPVGITGAPDALPKPDALKGRNWTVCAAPVADQSTGKTADQVVVSLNTPPPASAGSRDEGVLVQSSDTTKYLIWHGRRHRFTAATGPFALGYRGVTPYPVAPQWLNMLPAGADLASPPIPGRGNAGPDIGGRPTRVGQVFVAASPGTAKQYFVLFGDGLRQVSETLADLVLGDPATTGAYPGKTVAALPLQAAAAAPHLAPGGQGAGDLPPSPPRLTQDAGRPVCAVARAGSAQGATVEVVVPRGGPPAGGVPVTDNDPRTADRVVVTPGTGMLARALSAPGSASGAQYLVTDLGVKYPLPSTDSVSALGYEGVVPVPIPPSMLDLLPTGPALDRTRATATQPVSPPATQ
ncbi:type VII secretion protein EccB [Actinomadura sp. DC4]|uniref:type VII secretion protein EccB n=1 Tax=Actinomadura sp. DC4 TaxID=3055069 RepID=UPI0025B2585E|nr:type VII secretion protein EccB [Actinomadura sp. DC4]MDN3354776.1 type VII secretion protein EccB [Actinomadura sp. DC4]